MSPKSNKSKSKSSPAPAAAAAAAASIPVSVHLPDEKNVPVNVSQPSSGAAASSDGWLSVVQKMGIGRRDVFFRMFYQFVFWVLRHVLAFFRPLADEEDASSGCQQFHHKCMHAVGNKALWVAQQLVALLGIANKSDKLNQILEKVLNKIAGNKRQYCIINLVDCEYAVTEQQVTAVVQAMRESDTTFAADRVTPLEHFFALVSQLAYEEFPIVQAEVAEWPEPFNRFDLTQETYENRDPSTHQFLTSAVTLTGADSIIIAFRGTRPLSPLEWITDLSINMTKASQFFPVDDFDAPAVDATHPEINVHSGFAAALGLLRPNRNDMDAYKNSIFVRLVKLIQENPKKNVFVTGHSLGAALASVFAFGAFYRYGIKVNGVYTYGQPLCGDKGYANYMDAVFRSEFNPSTEDAAGGHTKCLSGSYRGRIHRILNDNDVIGRVPMSPIPVHVEYAHHGVLRFIREYAIVHTPIVQAKPVHAPADSHAAVAAAGALHYQLQPGFHFQFLELARALYESLSGRRQPRSGLRAFAWLAFPAAINDHFPCDYVRQLQFLAYSK